MSLILRRYFSEVTAGSLIYAINPMGLSNTAGVPRPEFVEVLVKEVKVNPDMRLVRGGKYAIIIVYYRFEEQFKLFDLANKPSVALTVHGDRSFVLAVDKNGMPIPFCSDREELLKFMGNPIKLKDNGRG